MSIDQVELRNDAERQMLDYLKTHDRVTHADLSKACQSVSDWQRTTFVSRLRNMGFLHDVGRDQGKVVFTIMDLDAAQAYAEKKRNTTPGAMWAAMRSLSVFTAADIHAIVREGIPPLRLELVQTYCSKLVKAEYLSVVEKAKPGTRPARYRLVKNTGPLPPQVRQLECIVDGNTDRLAYVQGARHV